MKSFCLAVLVTMCMSASAQDADRYFFIGVNPLSLAEPIAGFGPALGYRASPRFGIFAEPSYLFHNSYFNHDWSGLQGFRFILEPRYYLFKKKTFFIAPEFRIRQYQFTNTLTFTNITTSDTLHDYKFTERQLLKGGALLIGQQFSLSPDRSILIEITFGIGSRTREIKRKNIPSGYSYNEYSRGFALRPLTEVSGSRNPYFPVAFRIIKRFGTGTADSKK